MFENERNRERQTEKDGQRETDRERQTDLHGDRPVQPALRVRPGPSSLWVHVVVRVEVRTVLYG